MLCALEEGGQSYLFKLRLTKNVKRYIEKLFWEQDWSEVREGWEGHNGELKRNGWSRERRVIALPYGLRGEALLPMSRRACLLLSKPALRPNAMSMRCW
jgi:hypothetical protein